MADDENPWTVWERNFVEQMTRLREARRWTQTDLARELKVYGLPFHQQTIQRIEAGERPIRLNEANLIARVFGVDLETMTATGTPPDREMRYVVSRLRKGSEAAAEGLSEVLAEWLEDIGAFALTLSERLSGGREDKPDAVAQWGLIWAAKVLATYYPFTNAWRHLAGIHGKSIEISTEEEWEMALPEGDAIEALSKLVTRYANKEIHRWGGMHPEDLWNEFPGSGEDQLDLRKRTAKSRSLPASIREKMNAPEMSIEDLTPVERTQLLISVVFQYINGVPIRTISAETSLAPGAILAFLKQHGTELRDEDTPDGEDAPSKSDGGE